jgi:pimeloyl-ACP methyl ester carboxylesterase
MKPEPLHVPLPDGDLHALRWGTGEQSILALHGTTGSAVSWQTVARSLPEDWSLTALDIRGRGASNGLPGPYGLSQHVGDVLAAARHLGGSRPVLTGHSLGGYIALLAAAEQPDLFERLVLVDGGLPLPVPEYTDPDAATEAILGPALTRLRQTFRTPEDYLDFWRAHPAFTDNWSEGLEDYIRYDLVGEPGALRSRVIEEAVRVDGRDLLIADDRFGKALLGLGLPTLLLHAPQGMFGAPPGLLPAEVVAAWQQRAPRLQTELVPGTNHYTLLFDPEAAVVVASRLTEPADSQLR